jgi:two-component system response regulator RegX3
VRSAVFNEFEASERGKGGRQMRIVVVNRDKVMAKLMRFVLSEAGHDAVLAQTVREATTAMSETRTDAVLLDIDLPDADGCDFCKSLREDQFVGPVLFVSSRRDTKAKLRAFEYGADDYLVEPFDPQELVARIDVVARRYRQNMVQTTESMLKVGDAELLISELTFRSSDCPSALLTPTEMRLLECLMRNVEQTVSRETLIERTWGYDFFGDSNRVEVYVARLRKKIEPNPAEPKYLQTVRGLGYAFRAALPASDGAHAVRGSVDAARGSSRDQFDHLVASADAD